MTKTKNPFIEKKLIISDIDRFLKKYRSTIINQARKINEYFEMAAYNSIVKFYESNNYTIKIANLIDGKFRYKLSPTGYPNNFSYFLIEKKYSRGNQTYEFEVHHNIAIESGIEKGLFLTPDISVINRNSIRRLKNPQYFFSGSREYHYVENKDLQTFCEVKNYNPFPELVFNFIGILNELKCNNTTMTSKRPFHIAPSLMLSGTGTYHTKKIRTSLLGRYIINIFYGLFTRRAQPYSKSNSQNIQKIGTI